MAINFFSRLFSQERNDPQGFLPRECFPRLDQGDYTLLARSSTYQETHHALMQMSPFKTPGLDGYHSGFFQKM